MRGEGLFDGAAGGAGFYGAYEDESAARVFCEKEHPLAFYSSQGFLREVRDPYGLFADQGFRRIMSGYSRDDGMLSIIA
jgi:hypothetical protein